MALPKRGNARFAILECFANATDKLIENYDALARRDVNMLREVGAEVAEADVGVKFEEVTKAIFELLDLSIDEDVRKEINTNKDKVLIIAPSFSDDFIESAEMDTEVNISLLEAKGLKLILDAYKSKRNPKFSVKLLTKGGLLKAELIAKTI